MPEAAESTVDRRAQIAADLARTSGIDDAVIARLVNTFYDRVRQDAQLGPVFAGRVQDWAAHTARLCDFWSSVMLMSGRYHGQPVRAHAPLELSAVHFDRWLALFEASAAEVCPPLAATAFISRAHRIGDTLRRALVKENGADGIR